MDDHAYNLSRSLLSLAAQTMAQIIADKSSNEDAAIVRLSKLNTAIELESEFFRDELIKWTFDKAFRKEAE